MILTHTTRSSSFPSTSHPLIPRFNDHFRRLKSDNHSTFSSSFSSIAEKLDILENLHDCVDDLLISPHTQRVFARECNEKWVYEILDGYLGLVDACATAIDIVLQSKEYIFNILSALRRRRESNDLSELMSSRKITTKTIQKSLKNICSLKNKKSSVLHRDQETIAIISMLRETESITLDLIEASLSSISGKKRKSRRSGWSIVPKLIRSTKVSCQHHENTRLDFGDLDATLRKIVSFKTSKCETGIQIDELQQQLREMDSIIQDVEEKLECLFKRLIKSRVLLLNMHSQM